MSYKYTGACVNSNYCPTIDILLQLKRTVDVVSVLSNPGNGVVNGHHRKGTKGTKSKLVEKDG